MASKRHAFDAAEAVLSKNAVYHSVDISAHGAPERLIAATGPLDILVSSVAIQHAQPLGGITDEAMDDQFAVNFRSVVGLIQAVLPAMRDKRWGRIVTIGSVQERRPHRDILVYAALKSAQENFVRNLARQVASEGVTVNNVAPGVIATQRNAEALADPVYAADVMARIPAGRFGTPEDVAGAVLMPCSDAGAYVTGTTLLVDGGMSLG